MKKQLKPQIPTGITNLSLNGVTYNTYDASAKTAQEEYLRALANDLKEIEKLEMFEKDDSIHIVASGRKYSHQLNTDALRDGLYSSLTQVLHARDFSLHKYSLKNEGEKAKAREYVRRKLVKLSEHN